jgi:hypothetical protein
MRVAASRAMRVAASRATAEAEGRAAVLPPAFRTLMSRAPSHGARDTGVVAGAAGLAYSPAVSPACL